MPENQNSEILISMVRDLGTKVDSLPTRHEFDAFNQRLDGIENKIDKYVLQSEFTMYKEFAEQRLASSVREMEEKVRALGLEHDADSKANLDVHDDFEGRIESVLTIVDEFKSNRLPQWAVPTAISIVAILANIWIAFSHPTIQPQPYQQNTTTSVTSPQLHQGTRP